jgi:hypothetical protein
MLCMLRRLWALASALVVVSAGLTPCAAAAIARAPAAAAGMHAGHHGSAEHSEHAAGCHEPSPSLVPHCDCGCTGDRPHAVASSTLPIWSLSEDPTPRPSSAVRAEPVAAPAPRAGAPPPQIDHVPIAS